MDSYPHCRTKTMKVEKQVGDPVFGTHNDCNHTAQICVKCKGIFRKYTKWVQNNKFNMYAKHRQLAMMINTMTSNDLKKNVDDFHYLSRKLNSSLMRQIKIVFKEVLDDKKYVIFFNDKYSEVRQNVKESNRQRMLDEKNQKYYSQGKLIHEEASCYNLPFEDRYSMCKYCLDGNVVANHYRCISKHSDGSWQMEYPFMQIWLEVLNKVPPQRAKHIVNVIKQYPDFHKEVMKHIKKYTYDIPSDVSNMFQAQGLFETLFGEIKITHEHNVNIQPEVISSVGNSLISFVVTMVAIYCATTTTDKILVLMTALATSGLINIVSNLEKICSYITTIIGKVFGEEEFHHNDQYQDDMEDVYRAQAFPEMESVTGEVDFVKVLAGVLGASIGFVGFKGISSETWKEISMRTHTINSIERLWQTLLNVSRFILDVFATKQMGLDDSATQLRDSEVVLGNWADEIVDLVSRGGLELARTDVAVWLQAKSLYEKGLHFNAKLTRNRNYLENGVYTAFSYLMRVVGEIYKVGKHLEKNATLRNEPFVIYSFGEPGIGKSTLQMYMITDVMNKFDVAMGKQPGFRVDKNLFLRCPGEAFWSGYRETVHRVVVFDDLFQFTTEEKMVSEAIELIRTKNMVSYPLNMADLEDKGRTHFNSELIYCTANKPVPEQQLKHGVVAEARAISRRFDVVFRQRVVKKFSTPTGMIDPYKVSLEFPIITEASTPRIDEKTFNVVYEFDLTTPGGHVLKEGISYNQLVNHIVNMMVLKRENNTLLINTLNHLNAKEEFVSIDDVSFVAQTKYEEFLKNAKNDGLDVTTSIDICNGLENQSMDTNQLLRDVYGFDRLKNVRDNLTRAVSSAKDCMIDGLLKFKEKWNEIPWYPTLKKLLTTIGPISVLALSVMGAIFYKMRRGSSKCEKNVEQKSKTYFRGVNEKHWRLIDTVPSEPGQVMVELEAPPAGAQSVVGSADLRTMKQKVRTRRRFVGQASDAPTMQLIQNKIRNNTAVIKVSWAKNQDAFCRSTMRGFFLKERLFVVPSHIFMGAPMEDENITVDIRTSGGKYSISLMLKECEIYDDFLENRDLTFLRLPARVPSFPDITPFLHETQNLGKFVLERGVLYVCDDENKGGNFYFSNDMKKIGQFRYCLSPKESNAEIIQEIVGGFMYSAATTVGDCGAPLIWLNESNGKNKILGLHVAGRAGSGVATMLSKDMVEEVEKFFGIRESKNIVCDTEAFVANREYMEKAFLIGKLRPERGIIYKGKSEIVPSLLHGMYDVVETAPAILKYTKDVDPFKASLEKQFTTNIQLDVNFLKDIVKDISNNINALPSKYKEAPYLLDMDQCLNGVIGDEHILPMDMNTSPGYPYVIERREMKLNPNGKHAFIEKDEQGKWRPGAILNQRIKEREEDAIKGIITPTLFIDQLKDERREIEKVLAAKTRVFNVAPFDLNILVRKYFGVFIAHLMSNPIRGECAVGINPHGVDWKLLYDRLSCNGEYWLGGDYSNFDKTLSYQACMSVLEVIDDFYQDEFGGVRQILFQTMFSAYHLLGDTVYWMPFGNPSGIALTVIINSLVNMVYIRYAWCMVMGSIHGFTRNVALSVYGDDNIMTVSEECISQFNMVTISKMLTEVGITYTTPTKKEVDSVDIPLEELSYLKRKFRFEKGRVYAPLDIRSIKEMIMWTRVSGSIEAATSINCEAALRELYHYGKIFYDIFYKDMSRRAQKKNFPLPTMSYIDAGMYWGDNREQIKFFAHRDFDVITFGLDKGHNRIKGSYWMSEHEEILNKSSKQANASLKIGFDHTWGTCIGVSSIQNTMMNDSNNDTLEHSTSNTIATTNDVVGTNTVNNLNTLTSTTNQIMVMDDSGLVTHGNFSNVVPRPISCDIYDKPTLVDVLERTYPVHGVWNASDVTGTCLLRLDLPAFQISFPGIWAKLQNFQYFRADMDVSLRINGTKFHYGNLMMSWTPMGSNIGAKFAAAMNNVITASANPCVLVSPSENEAHHMTIPYALPYPYIPLSGYGQIQYHTGTLRLHVVNPLRGGAAIGTSVNYTVFIAFKNVDIAGFGVNNGAAASQSAFKNTTEVAVPYTAPTTGYFCDRNYMAQGRREVYKKIKEVRSKGSEEADKKKEKGIITTISETVAGVAGALIPIPEIGEVAMGVKTVADVVAGIAGFFGWTYPNSRATTTEVSVHQLQLANTHGLNDTSVLSITPENAIGDAKRWFGITSDEMSLIDIFQTPSIFVYDVQWEGSNAPNALIFGWNVNPITQYGTTVPGPGTGTVYYPTILSWAAQPFHFWRGSLRYHISIVASKMHVGRLRVVWKPTRGPAYDTALPATLSEDDLSNLMSRIVDIESETEIDLVVPYLNNAPWLPTLSVGYSSFGSYAIPNGQLGIYVVNALDYPETVVPSVGINVWVSAGADFQCARPSMRKYGIDGISEAPGSRLSTLWYSQGLTREMIREAKYQSILPASGSYDVNMCMGENIEHLKDLIMRPSPIILDSHVVPTVNDAVIMKFNPFSAAVCTNNASQISFKDYYSYIFRYSRGSINYKFLPAAAPASGGINYFSAFNDINPITSAYGYLNDPNIYFQQMTTIVLNDPLDQVGQTDYLAGGFTTTNSFVTPLSVTMPYFCGQWALPNFSTLPGIVPTSGPAYVSDIPCLIARTSTSLSAFISTGDDFQFIFRVGPPAMLRP